MKTSKEDFIYDYYNRSQDFGNIRERLGSSPYRLRTSEDLCRRNTLRGQWLEITKGIKRNIRDRENSYSTELTEFLLRASQDDQIRVRRFSLT